MRRLRLLGTPLLLAALVGCGGGKHPVSGVVTLEDGSPLTKGLVVFERSDGGPPIAARGTIGPDGRYELSTDRAGDGVPAGKYKVLINSLDLSEVPDEQKNLPFDSKYGKFETSGLQCDVTSGGTTFPIKLDRPKRKR
ncbi:peptidase associated/transthyretin-like domain-containing protein [Limnoglobus roseus]|uniref:Carboxypeptidase regulatory-like domain-containing protein n=1 Tax=Limnoglobus roseus TaxID=2598579 RepID=A0A5C1AD48_9BACT|nr:carboxypeptidase regulatory-like domain-containing protein [Limnoglobus roseus]QEL14978.1 carboxypeptidase regulatory-like domain-containing protein [Limnoglobus roseus]